MRKILSLLSAFVLTFALYAQNDVVKFLGIPIDGTKAEFVEKLKAKGFTEQANGPYLEGEFNGHNVKIEFGTTNNKVHRVIVDYMQSNDPASVINNYNILRSQFENNDKYVVLDSKPIPQNENLEYQMSVNNKLYQAAFGQKSATGVVNKEVTNRLVWFTILRYEANRYGIVIYYENRYNAANGQDL